MPSLSHLAERAMLVSEVMTRSVVTVLPEQTLYAAASLLRTGRFRHLPVVRGGRLVGIISDRETAGDSDTRISQIMHTDVITVSADTPVEVAAALMAENKIGALPVVDPSTENLVGIVSQTDLFVMLARLLGSDTPGTRLELQLHDLPRQLVVLGSTAQHQHVRINSLISIRGETPDALTCDMVMRVGTMDPRGFVAELREAGIIVSSADEL
jgi:acetoin utilization protein AcuB